MSRPNWKCVELESQTSSITCVIFFSGFSLFRSLLAIWTTMATCTAGIVNRGDSFRKRRSRSNSLAQEDDSGKEYTPPIPYNNNNDNNDNDQQNHRQAYQQQQQRKQPSQNGLDDIASYTVSLLGSRGVGKTALISQFMTSEYINAYEKQRGKCGPAFVAIFYRTFTTSRSVDNSDYASVFIVTSLTRLTIIHKPHMCVCVCVFEYTRNM